MKMQVIYGLAAIFTRVHNDAIALVQAMAAGNLRGYPVQMAKECSLALVCIGHGRNVFPRDDQHMDRGLGMKVGKSVADGVLENRRRRNGTFNDPAKQAAHGAPSVSLAAGFAGSGYIQAGVFGFHKPIVLPSTSANHAKVPVGMGTGGTMIFPPAASTFLSESTTSSVWI